MRHRVGSLLGAEFRSLWIADQAGAGLSSDPTVFSVSPLLQALIVEATRIDGQDDPDGYAGRVTELILDQLRRACVRRFTQIRPTRAVRTNGDGPSQCPAGPWRAGLKQNWV